MMHSWAKPTSTVELKRLWPLKILRSDCILTLHNSFVLLFKYLHSTVKEARNQSQIFNRKSISRNTTHRQSYHLQAMLTGVIRRKDAEPSESRAQWADSSKAGVLNLFSPIPHFLVGQLSISHHSIGLGQNRFQPMKCSVREWLTIPHILVVFVIKTVCKWLWFVK